MNIAILTTVINFDLYHITASHFPKNIPKYVIDGRSGMYGIHSLRYMMDKLKNKNIEWLVMADEDVVFVNQQHIYAVIEEMKRTNSIVSGVRDGGVIAHRVFNPLSINTFFAIIHFKEIEQLWDKKEFNVYDFSLPPYDSNELKKLQGEYNLESRYEPSYPFFYWLQRKNKKILFLDAKMGDDGISNYVLFNNEPILIHTWYARTFGVNETQTNRISSIINKYMPNYHVISSKDYIYMKDVIFGIKLKVEKMMNKIRSKKAEVRRKKLEVRSKKEEGRS